MNYSKNISLTQSKNLNDYSDILKEFNSLFGKEFEKDIKAWCNNKKDNMPGYWEVYLVKQNDNKIVGISGLYSLNSDKNDEFWLGWFGVLKKYRNKGIGGCVLDKTFKIASDNGTKELFVFTWNDNKAIELFEKKGFKDIGTANDFKDFQKKREYFNLPNDIVNIVSDDGGYVIIDAKEWRNIYETIYLNNIKGLSKSIIESSKEPLDDATPLDKVDW